jgi:hypothetical protein
MSNTTGVIARVMQRGQATNFVIDDVWYGAGFDAFAFKEGDTVSFSWVAKGNFKNVTKGSMVAASGAAPSAAPQAQSSAPAPAGRPSNTQVAIQYQASRNAAIAFVELAATLDAVPLPAKKGDRFDALQALVDDVTTSYHIGTDTVVKNGGVSFEEMEKPLVNGDDF